MGEATRIEVLGEEQLAARGAEVLATALRAAVAARGRASIAFSGGSTAGELLTALARADVPWDVVHVLQVDERVAPDGHPDRNLTTLRQRLLDHVPLSAGQLHPMPVTNPDLDAAARSYAATLFEVAGDPPRLDVVHLGLGADGHTASLTPGSALLEETHHPVGVTGPYEGRRRMTLTLPVLVGARELVWFVRGAAKAPMVSRLVAGDHAIPAGRVAARHARFLLDTAAASQLSASQLSASSKPGQA
jgi:6-phosphogluconolactonase